MISCLKFLSALLELRLNPVPDGAPIDFAGSMVSGDVSFTFNKYFLMTSSAVLRRLTVDASTRNRAEHFAEQALGETL
jgi:hypothetical protein